MHFNLKDAAFAAVFASLLASTQAIPRVTRSGRYLYNEDGSRFYIKGIAYQEQATYIDLALPLNGSIDRVSPSWTTSLMDQYLRTIDVFSKYDNVLAFNVGNEVVVQNGTAVAPFVKAAARDVKAYLCVTFSYPQLNNSHSMILRKSKSSSVLVGYTAINGPSQFRDPLANYLSCDPSNTGSDSTAIDLFGLND
ncbi:hypothetical protein C0993_010885 [Termitomyces sp. T159_Od127]|nr:hypothetical protein C0993_010885 [Termitomyces sp. T159_Od127]